jgi:shikimate kinase
MLTTSVDKNLLLTGYAGVGQIAIARRVSERLRMPLIDFEARLEARTEMPLSEYRAYFGETSLRTLENEGLEEISLARGSVLLIDGRLLTQAGGLARLGENALVICLVARLDTVLRRLHVMMGARYHDPAERDRMIGLVRREWAVRGQPGVLEVDTTHLDEAAIITAIIDRWRALSGVLDMGQR